MAKDPEQEIQKKLVELELSIKEDEAKKLPAVGEKSGKQVAPGASGTVNKAEEELNADLLQIAGIVLVGIGLFLLFTHITLSAGGFWMFGGISSIGLVIVPLLVGIGMLFYNYKSRVAQGVTAISALAVILTLLSNLRMNFAPITMVDLILMALPICAGVAMIAKSRVKHLALEETPKQS